MTINHKLYLDLAFQLAEKNLGKTKLNPSVGVVIVKNDSVISTGITSINGRPHAEFNALNNKDIFSSRENSSYYYSNGWHLKAIYSLFIGFIFAASTIWNENLIAYQSFSWLIGAIGSSVTYYLLANR